MIDFTHRKRISPKDCAVYLTLMAEDCAPINELFIREALQQEAHEAVQGNPKNLVIDMQGIGGYLKTSTVNAFVVANKILQTFGRRIVLRNVNDHAWEIIQTYRLHTFFDRDTQSEASDSNCLTQ